MCWRVCQGLTIGLEPSATESATARERRDVVAGAMAMAWAGSKGWLSPGREASGTTQGTACMNAKGGMGVSLQLRRHARTVEPRSLATRPCQLAIEELLHRTMLEGVLRAQGQVGS